MKRMKRMLLTLLMVIGMFAAFSMVSSAATEYYVTTASELNVRRGPNDRFDIVVTLPRGSAVKLVFKENSRWWLVKYTNSNQKTYTGYVFTKYLKEADYYKTTSRLYLRSEPTYCSSVVKVMPKNAKVIVLDTYTGNWYKAIYYANGRSYVGFCHQSFLKKVGAKKGKYITTDSVYMRTEPDQHSDPMIVVPAGKTVNVTNISHGKWYKCTYKVNGCTYKGYISNLCLVKK